MVVRNNASEAVDRAFRPSGTSSNEALRAELNSWMLSMQAVHQSTLRVKLRFMHFGKLLSHYQAMRFPMGKLVRESVLLARAVMAPL